MGLKINRILFIAFAVSLILHISVLFVFSVFSDFRFFNPDLFRVMFVNLVEEPASERVLGKSTGFNLLRKNLDNRGVGEKSIAENKQESGEGRGDGEQGAEISYNDVKQRDVDASVAEGDILKSSGPAETDRYLDKISEAPAEDEKGRSASATSNGSADKKQPLYTPKVLREVFHYDIFWLGIYVGEAVLEAVENNGVLRITSQVHSAPVISAFYRVDDLVESVIMDGMPVNFRIRQHEGKYRSDKETIFDPGNKIITFFNYLKGTKDEHKLKESNIWDLISGFYYLRTQPLEPGKPVYINIFDSNKFYRAKVDVLRKESIITSDKSTIETVIVKPELQSEGLFQRKGDILIWLTDDERRVPVRVTTKVPVGSVTAELRNFGQK